MNLISNKEKAQSLNSLLCLLQGCIGYETTVELRNDDTAQGFIKEVDGLMNINLTDVSFTKALTGQVQRFDEFYIQGKHVRYVHIPDELDIIDVIKQQLGMRDTQRNYTERQPKRKTLSKQDRKEKLQKQYEKVVQQLGMMPEKEGGEMDSTATTKWDFGQIRSDICVCVVLINWQYNKVIFMVAK